MWKYDRLKIHKRAMDTYTWPGTLCGGELRVTGLRISEKWKTVTCKNCLRYKS